LRNVARPQSAEEQFDEELPAETLANHRRLLLELAKEDEQKQAALQPPEPIGVEHSSQSA